MRILVVEDDKDLNRQLAAALRDEQYSVDVAFDGEEGHFLGDTEPYDAVVLDLGLPELDGVSVLKRWRGDGKTMPVLILTARDAWSEKVAGFDAGADDYVTKPFRIEEVLARIRALIRRASGHAVSELSCGGDEPPHHVLLLAFVFSFNSQITVTWHASCDRSEPCRSCQSSTCRAADAYAWLSSWSGYDSC